MNPHQIILLAEQLRRASDNFSVPEGAAIQIAIPKEDWDKLLAHVQQFEPVTVWPPRAREQITALKIHNYEIVYT